MLTRAVAHLDRDLVADTRRCDLLMVHFHRDDLLREIRGVPVKPDAVTHRQRALGQAHDGDARPLEVVDHRSDELLGHSAPSPPEKSGPAAD